MKSVGGYDLFRMQRSSATEEDQSTPRVAEDIITLRAADVDTVAEQLSDVHPPHPATDIITIVISNTTHPLLC